MPGVYLLLIILISGIQLAFSQNQLKEVLNGMSDVKLDKTKSIKQLSGIYPCFLNDYENALIAVSDPVFDPKVAFEQAYKRLLMLHALKNAQGKGMSDFYTDENKLAFLTNYEEICFLHADFEFDPEVLKPDIKIQLKTGEMILVLLPGYKTGDFLKKFQTKIYIYNKESQLDQTNKLTGKIQIENNIVDKINNKIEIDQTNIHIINHFKQIVESKHNQKVTFNHQIKTYYLPEDNCRQIQQDTTITSISTVNGLWNAMMHLYAMDIINNLKPEFEKMKHVSDRYDDNLITLNRESGNVNFSTWIRKIYFQNNELSLKSEFEKLNKN